MHIYNTPTIEGKNIQPICMVTSEVVIGINVIRDIFSFFTDFFGGHSNSYETSIEKGKAIAISRLGDEGLKVGGNAVVNFKVSLEPVGARGSMICINVTGTAVKV